MVRPEVVTVAVPPGGRPGDVLSATSADGATVVEAIVPEGAMPGDVLAVEVGPPRRCSGRDGGEECGDDEYYLEELREEVRRMIITVPPGASPGEVILIEIEGRGEVEFAIPDGARGGATRSSCGRRTWRAGSSERTATPPRGAKEERWNCPARP